MKFMPRSSIHGTHAIELIVALVALVGAFIGALKFKDFKFKLQWHGQIEVTLRNWLAYYL